MCKVARLCIVALRRVALSSMSHLCVTILLRETDIIPRTKFSPGIPGANGRTTTPRRRRRCRAQSGKNATFRIVKMQARVQSLTAEAAAGCWRCLVLLHPTSSKIVRPSPRESFVHLWRHCRVVFGLSLWGGWKKMRKTRARICTPIRTRENRSSLEEALTSNLLI